MSTVLTASIYVNWGGLSGSSLLGRKMLTVKDLPCDAALLYMTAMCWLNCNQEFHAKDQTAILRSQRRHLSHTGGVGRRSQSEATSMQVAPTKFDLTKLTISCQNWLRWHNLIGWSCWTSPCFRFQTSTHWLDRTYLRSNVVHRRRHIWIAYLCWNYFYSQRLRCHIINFKNSMLRSLIG